MTDLLPDLNDWRVSIDNEDLCWLIFDKKDSRVNTLGADNMAELDICLDKIAELYADGKIKGLGMLSAKEGSFVFGADVKSFEEFESEAQIAELMSKAHSVFQKLEDLKLPTAVGVDGVCLGGGLELALCFKTIIAVKNDRTKMGFPEVQLGLFPGFGGTARSIARVGGQAALTAMLTGKHYRVSAARAIGLVDKTVSDHLGLRWAVRSTLLRPSKTKRKLGLMARATTWPLMRGFVASQARKLTAKKARPEHYPAPYAIIDHFEKSGANLADLYKGEIEEFPKLMMGETSKNLRRIFFLNDRLKKQSGSKFKAKRVHVVGAGLMGGDIAAYCALRGLEVSLQDLDMDRIQPALDRAKKLFKKKVRGSAAQKAAMARLIPDTKGAHVARADVIIEAIVEKLDIKQKVFADLEAKAKPEAILATNTSALPLEDISEGLKDPSRLVGLHFFNPAAVMPLVEVVYGSNSATAHVEAAISFCGQIKKSPLKVKSAKGFLVNRVLTPYMFKALSVMQAGTSKEEIDAALLKFGMPMGPIELIDQVGLDVGAYVGETLGLNDGPGADAMRAKVAEGKLGMKTGEGFYKWEKRKPVRDLSEYEDKDQSALAEEIIMPLIEECQAAVDEGVVEDADLADIGVIFGTGFAPFRGGPLNYQASKSKEA